MPLPKEIDERVRKRFEDLTSEGETILRNIGHSRDAALVKRQRQLEEQRILSLGRINAGPNATDYGTFVTNVENLARNILDANHLNQFLEKIRRAESEHPIDIHFGLIFGYLKGLKIDYESGMLDGLYKVIETNITYDYMSQAEQLLEGYNHQYDHVPAAVLAGAVLEDALRRLCQRQNPPIDTETNGKPKTLDPLITDLQTNKVINKAKAAQLRSWAQIRNAAAHGRFEEFNRSQVDEMIPSIKNFLADYL